MQMISWSCSNELLPPGTTYVPKFVDVHKFSKKLKDVTEKTNIRRFALSRTLESLYLCDVLLIILMFSLLTFTDESLFPNKFYTFAA